MKKINHTKIDISKELAQKTGLPNNFSKKILKDLIIIMIDLIKENKLILKNIGTFKIIKKKERVGRNPKTKEKFLISKRKSISFKSSSKILSKINL